VRSIAQSLIEMHKEQAQGKGVSLAQLVDAEVPATLQGDAARLRQIMTQVLGNAVKFTQRGEIIVRVAVSRQSESQMWLHFSVSDTGIGIAPDIQKHVFEAFRQGDGSQTRRFGGTGMGLAIAKHTVELMGGEIGLESEPGKGSTFWWTVPLMKTSAESPRIQMATLPWVSARVLIVDDNVAQREIIRRHLSSWSLASEAASSGESGLDMIRREARAGRGFQICIVDLHLRDMDAMQFTQMLKKEPAFAEIRLIAMTTDEIPDPSVLRAFGFAQCIRKPVQPFELHNGLLAVVEAGQNRAA